MRDLGCSTRRSERKSRDSMNDTAMLRAFCKDVRRNDVMRQKIVLIETYAIEH